MNGEEFFNAINMIDDDLVDEAAFIIKTKRKKKTVYFTIAACLAVFVGATVILSEFGVFPAYETADDAFQNTGTTNEVAEDVIVGATGNKSPESIEPEGATGIYIPETAAPELQATAPGENTGSTDKENQSYTETTTCTCLYCIEGSTTPPQEAVTGEDVSSPPMAEETTTGKSQEYNGNSTETTVAFKAKIIEINGNSVMVEPLDAPESSSSDRIVFSKAKLEEINAKKGDVVIIVYDGLIMESYPAQINASSWGLAE